jgi:FlaA1/EpsC-like NDP-sugar epimerase
VRKYNPKIKLGKENIFRTMEEVGSAGGGLVVLVTGGTGFIGSHLLRRLVQQRDGVGKVIGLVRASSNHTAFPPGMGRVEQRPPSPPT